MIFERNIVTAAEYICSAQNLSHNVMPTIQFQLSELFVDFKYRDSNFLASFLPQFSQITNGFNLNSSLWAEHFFIYESTQILLQQLNQARFHLYYLTNNSQVLFEALSQSSVFDYFEGGVSSHEVGMKKPNPAIFTKLRETCGISPQNTLFIDDCTVNCAAAQRAGYHTFHFDSTNSQQSCKEITELLTGQ